VTVLSVRQVRNRFLILSGLRWLATGLTAPMLILLMHQRGLSLPRIGLTITAFGAAVLALELPTGGLADAIGRKPVLTTAWTVNLASLGLLALADTFELFLVAWALQGTFRALDSGPLESWYVDATLAADPEAKYESGLGLAGMVIGVATGTGALLSGGLTALGPIGGVSALTMPILVAMAIQGLGLIALRILLIEARPARGAHPVRTSVAAAPRMVREAVGLLRRSRVLTALVAVELFWGFGVLTFEGLLPIRFAEVMGDTDRAAALLGPASSVAWLAAAAGAAATPLLLRWPGAAPGAGLLRILQCVTVLGMGLFAGPVGVLLSYVACYTVQGAAKPLHYGLLHRQVDGPYRTSVVSLNSVVSQPAASIGSVVLTSLAAATSISTAMLVGGIVMALAAPLYLPAWSSDQRKQPAEADMQRD